MKKQNFSISFIYVFMAFFVFFSVVSCSNQQNEQLVPKVSKETFLSTAQQTNITQRSRTIFASFNQKMLERQGQKTTQNNDFLADTQTILQELLLEVRAEDSTAYDLFANAPQGASFLQNYTNSVIPQGYEAILNSVDTYTTAIDNEFNNVEVGIDTADNEALVQKLAAVTLNYETAILNDITLSNQDKTLLLIITTYMLATKDYLIHVAGNLSLLKSDDAQRSRFGNWLRNTTRTIKRVAVSALIMSVYTITAAVLTMRLIDPSNIGLAVLIGAAVGTGGAIYYATKNQCYFILNGRRQLRNCW